MTLLRLAPVRARIRLRDRVFRPGAARAALSRAYEESPEAGAALVAVAVEFLRGGGAVSLAEWGRLLPAERAALAAAGTALRAEAAAAVGYASLGPYAAAEVLSPADGGAAKEAITLAQGLARAVEAARGAVVR